MSTSTMFITSSQDLLNQTDSNLIPAASVAPRKQHEEVRALETSLV